MMPAIAGELIPDGPGPGGFFPGPGDGPGPGGDGIHLSLTHGV